MHKNSRDLRIAGLPLAAAASALCGVTAAAGAPGAHAPPVPELQVFLDASGATATLDVNGPQPQGAFFQSLGTNGRSCATCHGASQAMGLSAQAARLRFLATDGQDPLFAPVDGANCPNARRSDPAAHSLLIEHGLIRVSLQLPAGAQYTLSVVHDPYGCALTPDPQGGLPFVSVYRRPLPSTNVSFLSTIMFDGRETKAPLNAESTFMANLTADLSQQAIDATTGHAQATAPPSAAQVANIVGFELGLFSAQMYDARAGWLAAGGASGSVLRLAGQEYYPGINDVLGADPTGAAFNPVAMTLFSPWSTAPEASAAQRMIAAGEALFDSAPLQITNVRGLNDNAALGKPATIPGTCTSCHDTPNMGNHSLPVPLDIGTGHATLAGVEPDGNIAAALAELSMPDLPVYLVSGCPDPFGSGAPESFYTTDPGKALITGQCSDFNRGKGPILRGLAARAPYFHNGAAANLDELVNFYNQRFQMGLSAVQKQQLVAFLNSL